VRKCAFSSSYIRANFGMMLVRDYASCHVARRTVTYNACSKQRAKSLTFKSYRPLVGPLLKCKVRAWPLQLNLRELACVIHQKCAAIPQEYMHRHRLSMSTRYLAIDATPGPVFTKLFRIRIKIRLKLKILHYGLFLKPPIII